MWGMAALKSFLMAVHLEENKTRSTSSPRNPHTLRLLSPHAALWLARSHRIDGHEDVYKRHSVPSGSGVNRPSGVLHYGMEVMGGGFSCPTETIEKELRLAASPSWKDRKDRGRKQGKKTA
ncbi:hypothetical protein DPX16_19093 [Anabarilius grahami]|uniref:Uncharacterized protein n=1 Tax=Anabarilius grahami TaxID=495550 RepID=A0A3N0YVS8_ANAGA|nr:hypothetical protein DPX16_19093 [Anabarilius grahami]